MDKSTFVICDNIKGRVVRSDGYFHYDRRVRFFLEIRGKFFFFFDVESNFHKNTYFELKKIDSIHSWSNEHCEEQLNLMVLEKLYERLIMDDINEIKVYNVFTAEDIDKFFDKNYFVGNDSSMIYDT